jgi:sugar phosphate isomerase/epimerase/catechol 2,3-dioxygenase-like lactoylglutathione lyase family enzyme
MKVGIAASMWRGLVDLPFPEFVEYCRDAGAEVMELSGYPKSYSETLVLNDAGVEMVRTLTRRAGVQVCAVGCPSDLVQPTPEGMAEQVALIKRHVDVAERLGAQTVGLKAGNPAEGMTEDEAQRLMVETLKQAAPYAHERRIFLALENGGNVTNQHRRLIKIVQDAHDLYVRALLDVGNFLRFGYSADEVVQVVEELAPISVHVHFKDGRGHKREFKDTALGEGELDMERILRVIRVSGYLHPLCAQYEGPDQPAVYKRNVAWLRERVGMWETGADPGNQAVQGVRGFHHVAISSTSFENAFRFYGELLGMPLTPAQGISYSPVLLFQMPTGEQFHCHLHGPSQHVHVALEVADFEGTLRRLREAGVEVRNPDKRGDGSDFLFCKDFDGNTIELTHHHTWSNHLVVGNG